MGLAAVLLLLQEVFCETASDCTTKCAEDTMALLTAKMVTCETATESTKKTSVLLGHCRGIGVIVGRLWVCRLGRELMVCSLCL